MDRWSIYIDIEGFSSTYENGVQALKSLGVLMEGIYKIGSICYSESPNRLFAHQLGDGFVIVSEFGWPTLEQPTTIAIALMRAVLHAGGAAKAAISEGQFADIVGCYPKAIQDLYHDSAGGSFQMGDGLMTILPVMGTALINSFKLLHSDQTPSGCLILLSQSLSSHLPSEISFQNVGELSVVDWVHTEYSELDNLIDQAQLPSMNAAMQESALNKYISTNHVRLGWADNTKKYLNL